MFSLTLLLGMVALGFVGAEPFIPPENVGNFDVVHCQKLIVGGQNAFTMLATDGPQAELSLMSAENAGDNAVLHNIANIHVSKEEASVWLGNFNHAVVPKYERAAQLTSAQKEGFALKADEHHIGMTMKRQGKPFVGIGTESPSIHVSDAEGNIKFEK